MSLNGDLTTMELGDVLGWIAARRKHGLLGVHRRSTRKKLVFRDGRLRSASSNDPREFLGQYLIQDGRISEQQLFQALLRQEREGRLLGQILVDEGLLAREALALALKANATETAYDLFLWPDGRFEFEEEQAAPTLAVDLDLDTAVVVAEGARRLKEWRRLRHRFPTSEITFRATGTPVVLADPKDRQVFELATQGRSLAEISLQTHSSQFDCARRLERLCERRQLQVDQMREEASAVDPVAAIEALLRLGELSLKQGRFDAAIEAFEEVLALDRLNQEAKKGLVRVAESRERERTRRLLPPEKTPYVTKGSLALNEQKFDPKEAFLLSRINGEWDVRSILKLCPFPEDESITIFKRLMDREVIALR
jgi:tetratricopeptide (TPR) repeat protein